MRRTGGEGTHCGVIPVCETSDEVLRCVVVRLGRSWLTGWKADFGLHVRRESLGTSCVQLDCPLLERDGRTMVDRKAFDTATRIAAGDDGKNYDDVAITLH